MKKLLCLVLALVLLIALAMPAFAATNSPTGGDAGDGSGGGGKTSPQTGYNTAAWAAGGAVLLLAAGVCFVSARKKTCA